MKQATKIYNLLKDGERKHVCSYEAGGDSLNYTESYIEGIDADELIEELVNEGLEIYEASDGEYLGEYVDIYAEKDGDRLTFEFEVESEFSTTASEEVELSVFGKVSDTLAQGMIELPVFDYIYTEEGINSVITKANIASNYNDDEPFIITDDDVKILREAAKDIIFHLEEPDIHSIDINEGKLIVNYYKTTKEEGSKPDIIFSKEELETENAQP